MAAREDCTGRNAFLCCTGSSLKLQSSDRFIFILRRCILQCCLRHHIFHDLQRVIFCIFNKKLIGVHAAADDAGDVDAGDGGFMGFRIIFQQLLFVCIPFRRRACRENRSPVCSRSMARTKSLGSVTSPSGVFNTMASSRISLTVVLKYAFDGFSLMRFSMFGRIQSFTRSLISGFPDDHCRLGFFVEEFQGGITRLSLQRRSPPPSDECRDAVRHSNA